MENTLLINICIICATLNGSGWELWDVIVSFPFIKDGSVYPVLKKVIKEALRHLSM